VVIMDASMGIPPAQTETATGCRLKMA